MKAYVVYNKDISEITQSSSGAVFPVLAERIIKNGGVVFGVKFDDNFNTVHSFTEQIDGIQIFRGSKYIFSKLGDSTKQVAEFLNAGREVLFSGSPCQCGKISNYLDEHGVSKSRLIIVDIICHGAPQPKYWQQYLNEIKSCYKSKIQNVFFRYKTKGTKGSPSILRIEFENNKYIEESQHMNVYYRAFLNDYILMKSCYSCNYKGIHREWSDITIADAWGVKKFAPGFSNRGGNSEIYIRNEKAKKLFDSVKNQFHYKEIHKEKYELMVQCNKSMVNSPIKRANYNKFHEDMQKYNFHKAVEMNTKELNFMKKIRFKIGRLLNRLIYNFR